MSRQLPARDEVFAEMAVDGLEFARQGRRLAGSVPVAVLPRLVDILADTRGEIAAELLGEMDREGNAFLVLRLAGKLVMRCQRCLGLVVESLQITSRLMLVPPGRAWPDDELAEDGYDAVEAGKEMALLPMIEEEVLLALPIAPMHETCEPPVATGEAQGTSPFAALARLKKGV